MTIQLFKRETTYDKTHGVTHEVTEYDSKDSFFQFPAGEWSFREEDYDLTGNHYAYVRGTNVNDYVKLALWADSVDQRGGKAEAIIPYLPAARADRGIPFGAGVYADLINMAPLNRVICFDPHSEVMPDWIVNVKVVTSASFIRLASRGWGIDGVIIPDKGAKNRAGLMASALGTKTYQANKVRDFATGKLSSFECDPLPDTGKFLVVDDICDGGGTFMGLAEATGLPKERLALWVSHGVFSGNAKNLKNHYGEIFTTDSLDTASNIGSQVMTLRPHLETYLNFGDNE